MNVREFVEVIAQREAADLIHQIESGKITYEEAIASLHAEGGGHIEK